MYAVENYVRGSLQFRKSPQTKRNYICVMLTGFLPDSVLFQISCIYLKKFLWNFAREYSITLRWNERDDRYANTISCSMLERIEYQLSKEGRDLTINGKFKLLKLILQFNNKIMKASRKFHLWLCLRVQVVHIYFCNVNLAFTPNIYNYFQTICLEEVTSWYSRHSSVFFVVKLETITIKIYLRGNNESRRFKDV